MVFIGNCAYSRAIYRHIIIHGGFEISFCVRGLSLGKYERGTYWDYAHSKIFKHTALLKDCLLEYASLEGGAVVNASGT